LVLLQPRELEITRAFEFREGRNTFLQLITQLNEMKITAQLNKQLENLAQQWLLLNRIDFGELSLVTTLLNQEWTL
jgi:hypothetical protein